MTEKKTANKTANKSSKSDPTADLEKELEKHPAVESGQLKHVGNHRPDDPDAKS
jgi:hypothetical protein